MKPGNTHASRAQPERLVVQLGFNRRCDYAQKFVLLSKGGIANESCEVDIIRSGVSGTRNDERRISSQIGKRDDLRIGASGVKLLGKGIWVGRAIKCGCIQQDELERTVNFCPADRWRFPAISAEGGIGEEIEKARSAGLAGLPVLENVSIEDGLAVLKDGETLEFRALMKLDEIPHEKLILCSGLERRSFRVLRLIELNDQIAGRFEMSYQAESLVGDRACEFYASGFQVGYCCFDVVAEEGDGVGVGGGIEVGVGRIDGVDAHVGAGHFEK